MVDILSKLSETAKEIKSSIIRELLKAANLPGVISFGGGVPDPETFPRFKLARIAKEIIEEEYKFTLQYSATEGDPELKKQYIKLLEKYEGIEGLTEDNLVITVGSQQALYLIGVTFLDEDSYIAMSRPAYLGAVSAFKQRKPKVISVPLEEDGMNVDYLERKLKELDEKGEIKKFKYVYVVSNFHNPAGVTLSLEKRKKLLELAEKYDFFIVEDDPYGALRFEGEKIDTIFKLGGPEKVLLLNTFSKILSPGLRLGIVVGDQRIVRRIVMAKQAADLCTPSLTQRLAARYLERYDIMEEIKPTIELYKSKKDTMMKAFEENFADIEGANWIKPQGGLFSWLTLPEGIDTMEMLEMAKRDKILYIPGEAFYIENPEKNKMRVSFCLPPHEDIIEGAKRLRKVVENYAKEKGIKLKLRVK